MNTLMFAATLAAATNLTETAALESVLVEASRLNQTKAEMATHVDVLAKTDIDASGATTTVDLLEKRANLFLRKMNGNPALAQVAMRGYGANSFGRVKILVDGEILNNPDMAAQDLQRIPLRAIERVEILHGAQSVMHGGDASAGVINIITDNTSYEKKTVLEVHGGDLGQVGLYAGIRGGFEEEALLYFADFSFDRADGWRKNAWTEAYSAKGGLRKNFLNGSWLGIKAFYAETGYGLPGALYNDWKKHPKTSLTPKDHARNDVYGATFNAEAVIDEENLLSFDYAFRNRLAESSYRSYRSKTKADLYAFTRKLQYTNMSELFGFRNRFDLGTDDKLDLLDVRSGNKNDYSRYTGSLFAREEFFPLDELSVFSGVRGECYHTKDKFRAAGVRKTDSQTKGALAGEVGVLWRPTEELKLFAKWSRFYHAPLADEMFSYYGVPNLSLKPETGHSTELGLDWTILEEVNFNLTGFHTALEDEIMYINYGNHNAPDATARDGFETSLTWSREKVASAGILYSYVHSRFTEGRYRGHAVPLVPRQQVRLFGEIFLLDTLAVNAGCRFVGTQRYDSDFAGKAGMMPNYTVFDLGARAMPTWRILKGFTFAFTIDNLFDRRYIDYGLDYGGGLHACYPATGRSFLFTVRYEF